MQKVDVYTDGGCLGNPGPGGWAALIYEGPEPTEISGYEKGTTNQRMELRAAIESLRYLGDSSNVKLHSDSAYLINGMKQKWYVKWQENGWLNSKKKPVENPDLWKGLIELSQHHTVEWVKVKGHSGIGANERCDVLVQLEIDKATDQSDQHATVTPDLPENEDDGGISRTDEGTKAIDKRLVGETAENIFLSLVNQRGVFATSFDTEGLMASPSTPNIACSRVGSPPSSSRLRAATPTPTATSRRTSLTTGCVGSSPSRKAWPFPATRCIS